MPSVRFNARLDTSHHGPPHPCKDTGVVSDSLDRHPQCDGAVPLRCLQELHTQEEVFGVPTGTRPEDSSQVSVEAMQWILLYLSVMIAIIENISHSTAKMCRSTIMHIAHSCSDCQWYIFHSFGRSCRRKSR
jgi:hypothetical protein